MDICFWFCCLSDALLILRFAYTLLVSCLDRTIANKSLNDIVEFFLLFAGVVWLFISAAIFYNSGWLKTATVLVSVPFLAWLCFFLMPVIAHFPNKKIN